MRKGTFLVRVHREEGSFWAEVTDLPGCFASGDSMEELWEALTEAIGIYLSKPGHPATVVMRDQESVGTEADGTDEDAIERYKVLVA
jgi:hypothetical protein